MRVRVENPHGHLGIIPFLIGFFVAVEWIWGLVLMLPLDASQSREPFSPLTVLAALIVIVFIPRRCQHFAWCAVYGAIGGACVFLAPVIVEVLIFRSFKAVFEPRIALSITTLSAIGAPFGALAAIIWTLVYRYSVRKILMQDGTMCPSCAYCISGLPSDTCPECGKRFDTGQLQKASATSLRARHPRTWIISAIFLLAVYGILATARWKQITPPLYALTDGRFWKCNLAASERERLEQRWDLVGNIESQSRSRSIGDTEFRSVMGPPDWVWKKDTELSYVYLYYYPNRPKKGEIYIEFRDGKFSGTVGSNVYGVNDLAKLGWKPYDSAEKR